MFYMPSGMFQVLPPLIYLERKTMFEENNSVQIEIEEVENGLALKKLWLRKLIGRVWGDYCPKCGTKLIEVGYNFKTRCPKCK